MVKFERVAIVDNLGAVDYEDETGNQEKVVFIVTGTPSRMIQPPEQFTGVFC